MSEAERPALRVEARAALILRGRLAAKLGWLSVGLLLFTLAVMATMPPLAPGLLRDVVRWLGAGGLFVLPPLLGLAAVIAYFVPGRRQGAVAVDGHHLLIGESTRIPLSELDEGALRPENEVEIQRRGGDVVRVRFASRADAERFLAAVGLEASRRALHMSLGETDFLDYMSVLVGAPFACGVASAVERQLHLGPAVTLVAILALCAFVFRAMREVFGPARMTVGADGITIRRLFRERFFSHDRVADIDLAPQRVTLLLADGSRVRAKARHLSVAQQEALYTRFEQARRAWRAGREGGGEGGDGVSGVGVSRLDRNGRSGSAWREALRAALVKADVYRGRTLTREDLLGVLESPSAPGDRRLGAAVALADAGDAGDRTRIRAAAEGCADTRLRVALEQAAEGALDDAALEEAAAGEGEGRERGGAAEISRR